MVSQAHSYNLTNWRSHAVNMHSTSPTFTSSPHGSTLIAAENIRKSQTMTRLKENQTLDAKLRLRVEREVLGREKKRFSEEGGESSSSNNHSNSNKSKVNATEKESVDNTGGKDAVDKDQVDNGKSKQQSPQQQLTPTTSPKSQNQSKSPQPSSPLPPPPPQAEAQAQAQAQAQQAEAHAHSLHLLQTLKILQASNLSKTQTLHALTHAKKHLHLQITALKSKLLQINDEMDGENEYGREREMEFRERILSFKSKGRR